MSSPVSAGAGPPPGRSDSIRSALPIALLVTASVALVAAVVAGGGVLTAAAELDGGALRAVRIAGLVALVAGAAGLALQRGRLLEADPRGGDPAVTGLRTAAGIMVALALVGLLNPPASAERTFGQGGEGDGAPGAMGRPEGGGIPSTSVTDAGDSPVEGRRLEPRQLPGIEASVTRDRPAFDRTMLRRFLWVAFLMIALVLLGRVVSRTLGLREAEELEEDEEEPDGPGLKPPPDHLEALRRLLAQLATDTDPPADRIRTAYEALLAAFAAAGAGIEAQEAPHEHLRRAVAETGLQPDAPHRVASLWVAARYGERPVTADEGLDAVRALGRALDEVRGRVAELRPLELPGASP